MSEFKNYHPFVNLIYFVSVIGFTCALMNPVCLVISLFGGITYSVVLKGRKALKTNLFYILPTVIIMAVINPLFNHQGATVVNYLPDGNPLTLESVIYGVFAAVMIAGVICWFSCFNEVMTSDKLIYLFGKIIPSLSMIISMTLRFVPKFSAEIKEIVSAQKAIGRDISQGNIIKKAKNGLRILSVMVTRSLENSIETADSMKARGYGLPGRTSFSIFKFEKRDKFTVWITLLLSGYIILANILKAVHFSYFPRLSGIKLNAFGISVYIVYFILCMYPSIAEIKGVRKWKSIKSKM